MYICICYTLIYIYTYVYIYTCVCVYIYVLLIYTCVCLCACVQCYTYIIFYTYRGSRKDGIWTAQDQMAYRANVIFLMAFESVGFPECAILHSVPDPINRNMYGTIEGNSGMPS
jgi:hypothetical protein